MTTRDRKQRLAALAALAVCSVLTLLVVGWLAGDREPGVARATSAAQSTASSVAPAVAPVSVGSVAEVPRGEREAVPTPPQLVAQPPSKVISTSDCVIRGRAFTNDREQPSIDIELFALAGGVPSHAAATATTPDSDGNFVLRPETYGEFAVLALAAGHQPVTVRTTFEPHTEVVLAPIALERGAMIYGEVRKLGRRVAAGVEVRARLFAGLPDDATYDASGTHVVWSNGQFEWAMRTATTDAAGQFSLRGLATSRYSLSVANLDYAALELIDIERVVAPAGDVVLDVSTSTVKLHFFRGDTPAGKFEFSVRSIVGQVAGEYVWLNADRGGSAEVDVLPNSKLEVRVRLAHWAYRSSNAPGADTREILIGPAGSVIDARIDVPEPDRLSSVPPILQR